MYVRSEQKRMYRCGIGYVCRRSMCRTEEERSRQMGEVDDVYGHRKAGGVLAWLVAH